MVNKVSYLDHELSLPDGVSDELHRAGVGAPGQDDGVRRLGSRDQTLLESLLLAAFHLEVLRAALK